MRWLSYPNEELPIEDFYRDLEQILASLSGNVPPDVQKVLKECLKKVSYSTVLEKISEKREQIPAWTNLLHRLILASNYSLQTLFVDRVNELEDQVLFRYVRNNQEYTLSWNQAYLQIQQYSQVFRKYLQNGKRVAIYAENSPEHSLLDICCLITGIEVIPIATNSVMEHLEYILRISNVGIVIVSNSELLGNIAKLIDHLPNLDAIFTLELQEQTTELGKIHSLPILVENMRFNKSISTSFPTIQATSPATIMFTSGTTGLPKGIVFTHSNIVFKRYCRALALPKIGSGDRFLSYLPFFHTFGRWLELWGSIFWRACYCFAENPSIATLIENFQRFEPTIFISIPKKWVQLHERIVQTPEFQSKTLQEQSSIVHKIAGGKLRWGLSAAGHMDSEIFRFFQKHGIELVSGYGMTEATGGVTMTPPKQYRENSVGLPLPGIEIKRDEDGELCLRGGYVADTYFPSQTKSSSDADGWFHTGDIITNDADGYVYIVDRKKDIYKNSRGQTIAPAKIEALFEEFPEIQRCFLVGDGREYNTLLIYPNHELSEPNFKQMNSDEIHDWLRSLVISTNRFLSVYERIYDFVVIPRDFSEQYGELTAKNTFKRKVVEKNFSEWIETLYQKNALSFSFSGIEVQIPNWLLRRLGVIESDLRVENEYLVSSVSHKSLKVSILHESMDSQTGKKCTTITIGNCAYRCHTQTISLGTILRDPILWVANFGLLDFTGEEATQVSRRATLEENATDIELVQIFALNNPSIEKNLFITLGQLLENNQHNLFTAHVALALLFSQNREFTQDSLHCLENLLEEKDTFLRRLICQRLQMTSQLPNISLIPYKALKILLLLGNQELQKQVWRTFLGTPCSNDNFDWDERTNEMVLSLKLESETWTALIHVLHEYRSKPTLLKHEHTRLANILSLLARYGVQRPTRYALARAELSRWVLSEGLLAQQAKDELEKMVQGFRAWLGTNPKIAVHPETSEEYTWDDVLVLDDGMSATEAQRIRTAFTETTLLRESLFLLAENALIQLSDIPPQGIWLTLVENKYGRSIYIVAIQTRQGNRYQFTLFINRSLDLLHVVSSTMWMICNSIKPDQPNILPELGGYWPEYQIATAEYLPYHSVWRWLSNLESNEQAFSMQRFSLVWSSLVLRSIELYVEFWHRTGQKWLPTDPNPQNVSIPIEDYRDGAKIRHITGRKPFTSVWEMIVTLQQRFLERVFFHYPVLRKGTSYDWLFAPFLEVLGEENGLELLQKAVREGRKDHKQRELRLQLETYLEHTSQTGFMPRHLYLAIQRYHDWQKHNPMASTHAMIQTLEDIYQTYSIQKWEKQHAEIRLRYFMETCLKDCGQELRKKLKELIQNVRYKVLSKEALKEKLSEIANSNQANETEKFFLVRICYSQLLHNDKTEWVRVSGQEGNQSTIVITRTGTDGELYYLRSPKNPKEEARLNRLFAKANVPAEFSAHHCLLVLLNRNEQVLGGLFFTRISDTQAHLEKIVVDRAYRGIRLGELLLQVLFELLESEGYQLLTTQFFGYHFFQKFGFTFDRKYAGLVKILSKKQQEQKSFEEMMPL